MHRTERTIILTALFVAGLGLVVAIDRGLLGSGSTGLGALVYAMGAVLVLVAGTGTRWVAQAAQVPDGSRIEPRLPVVRLQSDVVVPGALALGSFLFVLLFTDATLQAASLLVAGGAFGLVVWAQTHARSTADARLAVANSALNVGSHLTAFFLFSVIYGLKVRSLYSATAIGIISALLLYELLARDAAWHRALGMEVESRRRTLSLYSLAGGLVAAEVMWGLNYWAALSTLVGGVFLLLAFYVIHGLISAYVDHRLDRRLVVEFGAVGVVGALVVFLSALKS